MQYSLANSFKPKQKLSYQPFLPLTQNMTVDWVNTCIGEKKKKKKKNPQKTRGPGTTSHT
jgi:hypothetical protein